MVFSGVCNGHCKNFYLSRREKNWKAMTADFDRDSNPVNSGSASAIKFKILHILHHLIRIVYGLQPPGFVPNVIIWKERMGMQNLRHL
jgi:hypothetical protein